MPIDNETYKVWNTIKKVVEENYRPVEEMLSKNKKRELAYLRFMVMIYLKENTNCSLSDIGRLLNRTHATIIKGLKTSRDLRDYYITFREDYKKFEQRINEKLK